jgi:SAM-dependent methyltransferase
LDVGTGTGTLARGFAKIGCKVAGLDPSPPLLKEGRRLDEEASVNIDHVVGVVEHLPFRTEQFDVVSAGQCWHWFDRFLAANEIARVLKENGVVIIAHFDWLPLPGNVVTATEQLILRFNPKWRLNGGTGLHPDWFSDLFVAHFSELQSFSFDVSVPYSHVAWRGRIRASAGVGATLQLDTVTEFDHEHERMLFSRFPNEPLNIPHRVWVVSGRKCNG